MGLCSVMTSALLCATSSAPAAAAAPCLILSTLPQPPRSFLGKSSGGFICLSCPNQFCCKQLCVASPTSYSRRLAAVAPCFVSSSKSVFPNPADADPPEVGDEDHESTTKFDKVRQESQRMRRQQEEEYARKKDVFRQAIELDLEGEEEEEGNEDIEEKNPEIIKLQDIKDDVFLTAVNRVVASKTNGFKSSEQLKREASGIRLTPVEGGKGQDEELEPEEISDLEGIIALDRGNAEEVAEDDVLVDPSFDLDFDIEDKSDQVDEPSFNMSLSELLDDARVVPILVDGDLDAEITGIQHDSRQVSTGNMFVCCPGFSTDGHLYLAEAVEKGAAVIVASKEISVKENVKAVVLVEDTVSILSALSAAFYGNPSQKLTLVGITGTNGKTTSSYLLKSMYEAMGLKTGLIGTIAYYINGNNKIEASSTTPDAVTIQKLMATMVHNGTEVCVMEASSHGLALDRCKEVDFDIAVFTNLTRDHMEFHKTDGEYMEAKGRLFSKMVDSNRHRKVVNIDDPNASYFIGQGNPHVPVVTFGMENMTADVFPLEVKLSLFETEVLVRTPGGNIEISSGLLGRHNVYNILTAVAVGIAVEAPLENIVRGIEEVDAISGRFELIDEEQAFAVIVDYAHTPDALSRLLDTVRECGARRIITVVGCGGDRDRGKRPIMAKIATDKSDVCILTSDNPRTEDPLYILDDMLAGVGWTMEEYLKWGERGYYPPLRNGHRLFVYDIRNIAVRAAIAMGEEGDAVVIAGKGHETYQIIGGTNQYFDDREECREALQHVDELHAAGIDTREFPWRLP